MKRDKSAGTRKAKTSKTATGEKMEATRKAKATKEVAPDTSATTAVEATAEATEATMVAEATPETPTAETPTVEAAAEAMPAKAAKVKPVEVIGDMEDLIKAFGSVEAVIEACQNPAQQKFVELYEFGDEPGAKGSKMRWNDVVVVSHDIKIGAGSRKVWIMMATPAIIRTYCESLRGRKYHRQTLVEALEAYKGLKERSTAYAAIQAFKKEIAAAYSAKK